MDGVLVAVKDEIDCLPYPTTGKPATVDQYCCSRLASLS
jgi:hypothetical protein